LGPWHIVLISGGRQYEERREGRDLGNQVRLRVEEKALKW